MLRREDGVDVDDGARLRLVDHRISVDVAARAAHADRWKSAFEDNRKRLNLFFPARWKTAGAVEFLFDAGRKRTRAIVVADNDQVLVAEAIIAISTVTVAVAIFSMLLAVILGGRGPCERGE